MLGKMRRPIAEVLFLLLSTCVIINPDSPHGGIFVGGGLSVRKQLEGGGSSEWGLIKRGCLMESLWQCSKHNIGRNTKADNTKMLGVEECKLQRKDEKNVS